MRYKLRRVEGEPVPLSVLTEMEQHPAEPWKVRDRMLNEMGWCVAGTDWAEWTAAALNRLFQEQGATGKAGRITAATVRHRGKKTMKKPKALRRWGRYQGAQPWGAGRIDEEVPQDHRHEH